MIYHRVLTSRFWEKGNRTFAQVAVRCDADLDESSDCVTENDSAVTCEGCLFDPDPKIVRLQVYCDGKPHKAEAL